MKVVEITRAGGPDVLQVRERPDPVPGLDQILISVRASGVNFADIMGRMGLYPDAPPIPYVPGYEVAGVVESVGPGVSNFRPGQRVLAVTKFQGYAEKACVDRVQTSIIPDSLNFEQAAAIPVNYLTAWVALVEMGRIRRDDKILVHQAAGGVGVAALQVCNHYGAKTLGIVGSQEKIQFIREQGATLGFVRDQGDWKSVADRFTDGFGFDAILESRGARPLPEDIKQLAPSGRVILFGVSELVTGKTRNIFKAAWHILTAPKIKPYKLVYDNVGIYGANLVTYWRKPEIYTRAMSALLEGVKEGWLKPYVDKTFTFDRAAEAHTYIQDRKNKGKVVLVP